MNITHQSKVGIDPAERFSISLLKVCTNSKKDQVTFYTSIKHDSGSIPEGTVVQIPFLSTNNAKDKTKHPIWVDWKPESGLFGFTMEIESSPNSDVLWNYSFETKIVTPDSEVPVTFETQLSKLELGPKVTLISSSILDNKLKVVTKVTRDDGRKTERATPVLTADDSYYQWDPVVGELTTTFTLQNPIGNVVDVDLTFSIGIEETRITTPVTVKSPVPRSRKMRTKIVGAIVEKGVLTFVANFRWASTGKPPESLSIPSTLESGTNLPTGSIKTSKVAYNPLTGDLRCSIKANQEDTKTMVYELVVLVTAGAFDPQPITLVVNTHAKATDNEITFGKPFADGRSLLVPFDVVNKKTGLPLSRAEINDYQRNAFLTKGVPDIQSPSVRMRGDVAHLHWNIDSNDSVRMDYAMLGVYSFGQNEFLYDIELTLESVTIESVTTEVGVADIVETIILSKGYPLGSITLAPAPNPPYPREFIHLKENVVKIVFHGAARVLKPTKRLVGAGLVFTTEFNRSIFFSDQIDLYLKPGEGDLKVTPISTYLISGKTIEVVSRIHWEDGTTPINVKMESVLDTPQGPVAVKRWEYESKSGLLRYYVDVILTGKKDEFEFKAILSAPDYNIFIGPVSTKITLGSNFYPYEVVGKPVTDLVEGNTINLEMRLTYRDGSEVKNITEVLSVEEVYPNPGLREFRNFSFRDGVLSLQVDVGNVSWKGPNYTLQVRFADDKTDDNSDKLAVVEFKQGPKFDGSLDFGWMEHSKQANRLVTKIVFKLTRHDGGKTQSYTLLDGNISNCEIAGVSFGGDLITGTITVLVNDPDKSAPLKGSVDFLIDGNLVTLNIDEVYRVPGKAEYKGMKLGDDSKCPLEVTWIIGGWTSHHSEHVSINERRWKDLVNVDGYISKCNWDQVSSELTVKFAAKIDPTENVRYSGNNVFMLPSPDMSVYPISFDGEIPATELKPAVLSAEPIGVPYWNEADELIEFRYRLSAGPGREVGIVQVSKIDKLYPAEAGRHLPYIIQENDILIVKISPKPLSRAILFDITFESDGTANKVTVRDGYSFGFEHTTPEILFVDMLPNSDVMRVYWANPGMGTTGLVWGNSPLVRSSNHTVQKDERTNILQSEHIVFPNPKEDVRHPLCGQDAHGNVVLQGIATVMGVDKPHNRLLMDKPKITVNPAYIEYVYPTRYEGTQIGPESIYGEVIDQTGAFHSCTITGNATARTVTIRVNKYDFPNPVEFSILVQVRDGKAKKPTTLKLEV